MHGCLKSISTDHCIRGSLLIGGGPLVFSESIKD